MPVKVGGGGFARFRIKWQKYGVGTIASKINVTPKGGSLHISKLNSILAVEKLLAHNNISQICYCGQISLQSAAVNCCFSDTFGGNIYFAGDDTWSRLAQSRELSNIIKKLNKTRPAY